MIEKDVILLKEDENDDWCAEPDPAGVRSGDSVIWNNTGSRPVKIHDPSDRLFQEGEVEISAGEEGQMTIRNDLIPGESYAYEVVCAETARSTPPIMIVDRDGGHG
ncbi:MAG: hypothetical protein JW958_13450 [Candidatus Eisenbacteria bacterium]|nr:hypothetical protein [Candidatus Eisenbacteria bacterium]